MAQDTTQIVIGTCDVTWGATDLGHTIGGVEITYAPEYTDILADLYGNTIVNKHLVGEVLTAKMSLTQWDLDVTLDAAQPIAGTESATKRTIGSEAGDDLLALAQVLVLHPSNLAASSRDQDIVFYKAAVHNPVTINRTNDGQTQFEVEFIALIDTTKSDGNLLGLIGDSTT